MSKALIEQFLVQDSKAYLSEIEMMAQLEDKRREKAEVVNAKVREKGKDADVAEELIAINDFKEAVNTRMVLADVYANMINKWEKVLQSVREAEFIIKSIKEV